MVIKYLVSSKGTAKIGRQVKNGMTVIKCYKLKREACGKEGTAQVWFGKTGELKF